MTERCGYCKNNAVGKDAIGLPACNEHLGEADNHVKEHFESLGADVEEAVVLITLKEYRRLMSDSTHLDWLVCQGVDNWGGYGVPNQYIEDAVKECEKKIHNAD